MRRRARYAAVLGIMAGFLLVPLVPAEADHTNPNTPQWLTGPGLPGETGIPRGAGTWTFLENFPPNPGSDLKFFEKNGDLYSSSGTLGQAQQAHIGQRILRLIDREVVGGQVTETVDPTWVADHGSSKCDANPNVLGLQHDVAVTPRVNPVLMADSTDSTGRCHDTAGGGLELIDISGLGKPGFEVRELHLIHLRGLSHTVTADPNRPGIFYNNASDSATATSNPPSPGNTWIDVINARSCMRFSDTDGDGTITLAEKREQCRPQVYRLSWEHNPEWSQRDPDGEEGPRPNEPLSQSNCHDTTVVRRTLYCAGLNATLVFDISRMFVPGEGLNGRPLPMADPNQPTAGKCHLRPGTRTGAMVTDCSRVGPSTAATPVPHLRGWRLLGNYNHPGRPPNQANNNLEVPSEEGVSISHESDPSPDNKWLFVTDERGGGVVPPGSSCSPGIDNPYGNGGIHVLDLTRRVRDLNVALPGVAPEKNPPYFPYAKEVGDDKAVWRGSPTVPAATFCTVHVIHHIPDERRIFMGYYSQGIKVLDYSVTRDGVFTFTEVASFTVAGANSWTAEPFKIVDNVNDPNNPSDDTRTYYLMSSDIQRGIDFFTWTGPTNPIGRPERTARSVATADAGLLVLGPIVLAGAAWVGRRRRVR